jgi:hypothetical protein
MAPEPDVAPQQQIKEGPVAGQKYGRLTVIASAGLDSKQRSLCQVQCDCATVKTVRVDHLKSGDTKSCGKCAPGGGRRPTRVHYTPTGVPICCGTLGSRLLSTRVDEVDCPSCLRRMCTEENREKRRQLAEENRRRVEENRRIRTEKKHNPASLKVHGTLNGVPLCNKKGRPPLPMTLLVENVECRACLRTIGKALFLVTWRPTPAELRAILNPRTVRRIARPNCPELGECWEWQGAKDGSGYGLIGIRDGSRTTRVHRLAYTTFVGPLPPEKPEALHHCDNPPCWRPDHLYGGTKRDNVEDKVRKGRQARRGKGHGKVKFTDTQVAEIRARYAAGGISRRKLAKEYGHDVSYVLQGVHRPDWGRGYEATTAGSG